MFMSSKNPKKQRKQMLASSIKERRKFLKAHASKELRKETGKRSIPVRKGDTVKVMRGEHKKATGKVTGIDSKSFRVFIEGLKVKKSDGTEKPLGVQASNIMLVELDRNDDRRFKRKKTKVGK